VGASLVDEGSDTSGAGVGLGVVVVGRGVVGVATCHVGDGGTITCSAVGDSGLLASCNPTWTSGGASTVRVSVPNAPPTAPTMIPETTEKPAIARAPIATFLSFIPYPSSAGESRTR
ncbi:MAG: hypothetical protein GX610_17805, partial [Rhodococcus sp.]|nr:hypothetical protein [Rhodococcus sp. (in: high G+C Gram-positive bacteria)]